MDILGNTSNNNLKSDNVEISLNSYGNILNNILYGVNKKQDISSSVLNDVSNQIISNEQFWFNNPKILIEEDKYLSIWPNENMSKNEKLNSLSRLIIYITIIGFIFTYSFKILISGIVTLGIFVFLHYSSKNNKENFCNFTNIGNFYTTPDIVDRFTMPKNDNPTMNVMLPEISNNPDRNMAAPSYNPVIKEQINDSTKNMIVNNFQDESVRDKLFTDLGDNFQFEQSMRNFYTTPNTTIPNNQGEFARFCYGDMISCKEGNNIACIRHNPNHVNI